MKKAVAGGVSILLLIGVIVIAVIFNIGHLGGHDNKPPQSSASIKAVTNICAPTDYKDLCVETLSPSASSNSTNDPIELIKVAFMAALQHIQSASHLPSDIANKTNDPMQQAALSDCKDLLQYAEAELQAAYSEVGDKDMHTLSDRVNEIRNWLSAVISYQETCTDGLTHPELKSIMQNGLLNATQLTSNALAIVSEISSVLSAFNIPFNLSSITSRHLLEQSSNDLVEMDMDGYPSWFSASDRKLLAVHHKHMEVKVKPHVVVAQDGSGNFKKISDALNAMPKRHSGRYVIYVKAGIYRESVTVTEDMVNVFMYGDGPRRTIVTGSKNYADGTPTYQTATFAAIGTGFIAKSMGFSNTAGPNKHQAVALRVLSDMSAFFNCRMDGYQDTLYVQTHRQFYRNCIISGTIDFIFGDSAVVIQNSLIIVRKPMDNQFNAVTAQGRKDRHQPTGIVIHNCRVVPEKKLYPMRFKIPTYLGRPWKQYARTVVMESELGDFIQPQGWKEWKGDFGLTTLLYAEYGNRGPGARTNKRVNWPGFKVITNRREALQFTAGVFINGASWIKTTGAPYILGLMH
ncbi:hypothetical protein AAC387_Pa03g1886 [Persea americana]